MIRAITLVVSILLLLASTNFAQSMGAPLTGETGPIQSRVKQFAGTKKRVVVVTNYSEKFKGYITSYDEEKFTLDHSGSGQSQTFRYNSVKKVQKSGGLSVGSIAAIVGVAAGAAILIGVLTMPCRNEGNCF